MASSKKHRVQVRTKILDAEGGKFLDIFSTEAIEVEEETYSLLAAGQLEGSRFWAHYFRAKVE